MQTALAGAARSLASAATTTATTATALRLVPLIRIACRAMRTARALPGRALLLGERGISTARDHRRINHRGYLAHERHHGRIVPANRLRSGLDLGGAKEVSHLAALLG